MEVADLITGKLFFSLMSSLDYPHLQFLPDRELCRQPPTDSFRTSLSFIPLTSHFEQITHRGIASSEKQQIPSALWKDSTLEHIRRRHFGCSWESVRVAHLNSEASTSLEDFRWSAPTPWFLPPEFSYRKIHSPTANPIRSRFCSFPSTSYSEERKTTAFRGQITFYCTDPGLVHCAFLS